jgi:prepilin-type N-terminal cleavage/methylation domain-containing protein
MAGEWRRAKGKGAAVPSPPTLHPSPKRGFSLIELVISMGILSVGLVGAMRVFPMGLRASQRSELSSRSAIAAQKTLESLKLQAWGELPDGEQTAQEGDLQVTTRIASPDLDEPLTDPLRLKRVEVTVRPAQGPAARAWTFVTYLRRDTAS